jgi:hypothetical protein
VTACGSNKWSMGLLNCPPPAMQKRINTVAFALFEKILNQINSLESYIEEIITIMKNVVFQNVILAKATTNSQNIHLNSYY